MRLKDQLWNNVLIFLAIFVIGAFLIICPFHGYLTLADQQIRQGRHWLPLVVGIAYFLGFFVTRVVDDSFNVVFSKAPFSEIGEQVDNKPKHPSWVDKMLGPIAYTLFVARVALIIGAIALVLHGTMWVANFKAWRS